MAIYRVQGPDGKVHRFEGPDGATPEQVTQAASAMFGAKPKPSWDDRVAAARKDFDPTAGMGFGEQVAAGGGKFLSDMAQGAGQWLGLSDRKAVDEKRRLDAPLEATAGGKTGEIGMGLATAVPMAFVPGANTMAGATAIGAGYGALRPTGTGESTAGHIATDAALGAGGTVAGRALAAGWKGIKALIEPFRASGQEQIVGRVLNEFATDPAAARAALQRAQELVPGSVPTAAQAAGDAGLASLDLAARSTPAGSGIKERMIQQAQARAKAVGDIAGDAGKRDFHVGMREQAAKDLYGKAFEQAIQDTPWMRGQMTQLMRRPAFAEALRQGQEIAMNEGVTWGKGAMKGKIDPSEAVKVLHYAKTALDDMIGAASAAGKTKEAAALGSTRDLLLETLESKGAAPAYAEARRTYAEMSRPINQMDVGRRLYDKLVPALSQADGAAVTRTKGEQFAKALLDEDATLRAAVGRGGSLETTMTPEQMATLRGVHSDMARAAATDDMAKTLGSTTAQNLASQNLLQQMLGPTGMPTSWAQSALLQSFMRPVQWAAKTAEPKIQDRLAAALLNPQDAAALMAGVKQPGATQQAIAEALSRYLPASSALAGAQLQQQ